MNFTERPRARALGQGIALGGRAVTDDALAGPASADQALEKRVLRVVHAGLEFLVRLWRMQAGIALGATDALRRLARAIAVAAGVADEQAQGPAVGGQFLNVEDTQGVASHEPLERE